VGANGYVLSANSACSLGLEWVQNTEGDVTSVQATFPLTVDNTNPQVPVLGVGSASLLSPGVVQLSNTVTSTSTSQAATANAVKDAYDRGTLANTSAAAAQATANAAQSDATQALLDAATAQGTADQAVLDAAAAQSDATQALSDAAAAQTDADQALLDAAAAQSTADAAIPCAAITGKGAILTGSAASTPSALAVGTNGKVLAANSACASGLEWITPASTPQASQTSLGTLYGLAGSAFGDNVASGWGALGNLNTGLSNTAFGQCALYTNGFDSNNTAIGAKALAQSNGANGNTAIGNQAGFNLTTGDQNTIIGNSVDAPVATGNCQLAIGFPGGCWLTGCSNKNIKPGAGILDCAGSAGTAGQVLMSNGANAICWGTASGGSGIPCSTITAKGALVTGTAANTPSGLTVGTNGQVLTACSACTTGLTWVTPAAGCLGTVTSITAGTGLTGGAITTSGTISLDTACVIQPTILTAKGSLISASAASTPTALSVGTDGQILYACSTAANGLCWAAAPGGSSPATPTVAGVLEGYSCGVDENISVGFGSMPLVDPASGGCRNTSLGVCALSNLTFGSGNVAIGSQTLFCATNSGNSIAIGNCALRSSTFSGNVAIGNRAACTVTTGDNNVAIGSGAMQNATTPSLSIAIGCRAMQFGSGSGNMGFGLQALCKVSGNNNIGLGYASGSNLTTGSNNTFLGSLTGGFTTTGCCNIFIGFGAGPLSNVDCCLWIGLDSATPWLTGNNTSALKPGAGIIDCAGSCGTAGQVLMSTGSNALCWGTVSSGSGTVTSVCAGTGLCGGDITTSGTISLDTACIIQPSAFTAKGNILSATAANTPTALPVGTDGQVLSACSACSTGLVWATPQTSPFITYTTSAISYTNGTPVLVAVWNGGFLQGTITLDLVGYGGVTPFWDIFLSGDATNYNTGWYQTAFWPPTTDGLSQGTWYVDFPVYPSANNGKWEFYFNPTQDSLNPSSFTFFFRTNSVPTWQI
jgi:hypothetical protein